MNKKYLGLIAVGIVLIVGITLFRISTDSSRTFASDQELLSFLKQSEGSSQSYRADFPMPEGKSESSATLGAAGSADANVAAPSAERGGARYSDTNVQVLGIDEPDILKNDWRYLYAVSGGYVTIIDAYPTGGAKILKTLKTGYGVQNILLSGDKMVVFGYDDYYYGCPACDAIPADAVVRDADISDEKIAAPYIYPSKQYSFIAVYDISDRSNPSEVQRIKFDGSNYDSRLIGSKVYAITNQPIYALNDGVELPIISYNDDSEKIAASEIWYPGIMGSSYQLTTVFTFDLNDPENVRHDSFLTSYAQSMYVSENAIYLVSQKYVAYESYNRENIEQVYLSIVDGQARTAIEEILAKSEITSDDMQRIQQIFADYYNRLGREEREQLNKDFSEKSAAFSEWLNQETDRTVIDKLEFDGDGVRYAVKGEVAGHVLNQFSMDEYNGYFRIATTTGSWGMSSVNNIFVLDSNLDIVGKLGNLARNEQIYSARFMGDRAYLVTFKQIDPLFVIDLSDPFKPSVLGELKVPGYSTYLHPYDDNHIIGIGQDTSGDVQEGNVLTAIPAGVKLALFDVSDVNNPKELSHVIIGKQGSYSNALYDHKAFLFDKETGMLVLPISEYGQNYKLAFDGAYVYHLDLDGFELKGKVTHMNATEIKSLQKDGYDYYYDYMSQIQRSTFIDDVLYTMSQRSIEAHDIESLKDLISFDLPNISYPIYYGRGSSEPASVGSEAMPAMVA